MSQPAIPEPASSRILPVFPLPETVFFPRTTLPLHVFEPRYRQLVRDVADGDGRMVVALATPGGFHEVGTLGRLRDLEPFEDGRFNLRLEGLERVSLAEVPVETAYRQVRATSRRERTGTDDVSAIEEARLELLGAYLALLKNMQGSRPVVLHQGISFETVVNMASAGLPIESALRQRLLDLDTLMERNRVALEYVSAIFETWTWLRAVGDPRGAPIH